LDETDIQILKKIQADSRLPMSSLARAVGMSRPSVVERIRRMEEEGVISVWRVELNPARLGFPLTVYIRVRPMHGHLATIARLAQQIPQVVECDRITGEDCFIMKASFVSIKAMEEVIDRFIPYGQTTTSIVQSSPVPLRPLPLPHGK